MMEKTNKDKGMQILKFANLMRRELDMNNHRKCIKGIPMSNVKFILFLWHNQDKDIYQKTIEEAFSIRPSTVSRSLKALEEDGYITRTTMEHDSRLKKITLTTKAIEMHSNATDDMSELFRKMTINISNDEIQAFMKTLKKMCENLERN